MLAMSDAIARCPSPRSLASLFGRYGSSTFGGGAATIVEIERRIIDEHAWLDRADSLLGGAIARLTPRTNSLAYWVGAGWRIRGVTGAVVAVVAASVPSAALATGLTWSISAWSRNMLTAAALRGAVAAFGLTHVIGLTPNDLLLAAAVLGALWPEPNV
jgi:chromate transporter